MQEGENGRKCAFLEFTRPMYSWEGTLDEPKDWVEKKDIARSLKYANHKKNCGGLQLA